MKTLYKNDGEQLTEIFRRVKTKFPKVCTSLDMSLPDPNSESGKVNWRRIVENTVPYIDIFLPSAEEMMFMLHPDRFLKMRDRARAEGREVLDLFSAVDVMELSDELLAMGSKIHNIKCGHRGIYTRTASRDVVKQVPQITEKQLESWCGRELWHASFHVDPIGSATGSGDSSIAGFLASYLRGLPAEEAIRMSNAVGGCNVTKMDALSGIKSWDETCALIPDWVNNPPHIDDARWKEVVPQRLWTGPRDRK
jgi:sugar/nucleoside kinase (ribokinase family)